MKLFAIVDEDRNEPYGIYYAESPEANAIYVERDGVVIEMAHCEVIGGEWIQDASFTISEDETHYHTLVFNA